MRLVVGCFRDDVKEIRSGPLDLGPEVVPHRSDEKEEVLQRVAHAQPTSAPAPLVAMACTPIWARPVDGLFGVIAEGAARHSTD
jgi:hypothetical protein